MTMTKEPGQQIAADGRVITVNATTKHYRCDATLVFFLAAICATAHIDFTTTSAATAIITQLPPYPALVCPQRRPVLAVPWVGDVR